MIAPDPAIGAPWWAWVIAGPLAAACAMAVFRKLSAALGLLAGLIIACLAARLILLVAEAGAVKTALGGWAAPLGIELMADGLSAGMLGITALVGSIISIYAAAYFRPHTGASRPNPPAALFWPLWMFLWAALNALFLSADIFNMYVTLELMGLSAVALTALSREPAAVSAALRYLLVSLLGSLCYLMGVALLYGAFGTLGVASLAAVLTPAPAALAALALMSAGLMMKAALFPLHFWLPPAHAAAPAPVSALLSALVVKASFYLLLRLWFDAFGALATAAAAQIPGFLGAAAILWGSVQALSARRLKLLVAYSTVAQLGYLFLVFPLAAAAGTRGHAWSAALYFVIAHACAKAAVFLAAGNVLVGFGHDRIDELRGAVQDLPVSMFAFAVAGVSLIGLPPSGGFIAKWLFLTAAIASGSWFLAAVVVAGGFLSTAYIFRFFSRAFSYVAETHSCCQVPPAMEWSALALAVCALALGLTAPPVLEFFQVGAPLEPPIAMGGRP